MRMPLVSLAPLCAAALVAGCHKAPATNSLDAMDNDLVNGAVVADTDAAARDRQALAAAIRVNSGRLPAGGVTAGRDGRARAGAPPAPARIATAAPAAMPAVTEPAGAVPGASGACMGGLAYGAGWAARLPADLPMAPGAHLQEAAGHDGGCQVRIASFTVAGDRGQILGWYAQKARAAGYSVGRDDKGGDWILAGDRGAAAYYIILGAPSKGETPVDYIWANGH